MNILTGASFGLWNDGIILRDALEALGYPATVQRRDPKSFRPSRRRPLVYQKLMQRLGQRPPALNFHIEEIHPGWLAQARANVWIPNQEWLYEETLQLSHRADAILCKTLDGARALSSRFPNCHFVGFHSRDRYDARLERDYSRYIHLMGQSLYKGTRTLLEVWAAHPEWPLLEVFCKQPTEWNDTAWVQDWRRDNISVTSGVISEAALHELLNTAGVHLCPSEVEGFGHYIMEAMSTKSVVLTTDAPPMNEHVSPDTGFLAGYSGTGKKDLGTTFFVDPADLERAIQRILDTPEPELSAMGVRARARYKEIGEGFTARLGAWMRDVAPGLSG